MPTPDELKVILEKLATGTATDEEIEATRQACTGSDKITLQVAKYINNINHAQDSQFGDTRSVKPPAYRIISQNQNPDNDGYFFEYFAYHLYKADRQVELRKLLLNFNWLQKKLDNTNINALIRDYNYFPDDAELRLIQKAIVLSAHILEQDKKQLWSQLQGRLIKRTSTVFMP